MSDVITLEVTCPRHFFGVSLVFLCVRKIANPGEKNKKRNDFELGEATDSFRSLGSWISSS